MTASSGRGGSLPDQYFTRLAVCPFHGSVVPRDGKLPRPQTAIEISRSDIRGRGKACPYARPAVSPYSSALGRQSEREHGAVYQSPYRP